MNVNFFKKRSQYAYKLNETFQKRNVYFKTQERKLKESVFQRMKMQTQQNGENLHISQTHIYLNLSDHMIPRGFYY